MKMSIVFFGTAEFAVPILEKLAGSGHRPVLVVTTPDAPKGKKQILTPPPVKVKAMELGLPIYQPTSLRAVEAIQAIKAVRAGVGVLAAYGKIVPKAVIDLFPKGTLNVHPSLLPRWRGPAPIQSTILAGDEKTGATIILIDEEVDHGSIIAQKELKNENLKIENYETLHNKLAALGAELLIEILPKWLHEELSPVPQDHVKATFCHKFTREDAKIDWSKSAVEIDRMVRALNPEPGTWTQWPLDYARGKQMAPGQGSGQANGPSIKLKTGKWQILKILRASPVSNSLELENRKSGEIVMVNGMLVVKCGEGALAVETVQPEGKKQMPAADFLRGHRDIVGVKLG